MRPPLSSCAPSSWPTVRAVETARSGATRPRLAALAVMAGMALFAAGCGDQNVASATSAAPAPDASTSAAAPPSPVPSPSPTPRPKPKDPIRAIYISGWTAGGTTRWGQLIGMVEKTPLNAVVIDVKEDGMMSYATPGVPLAVEVGANHKMIPDVDAKIAELDKKEIYAIARITCFRDKVTVKKRPDLAVQRPDGSVWRDASGHLWLDPYNKANWDYNVDVAIDAVKRGFDEIQWDYVRFPSEGNLSGQRYPAKGKDDQRSRARVIAEFLAYSREKLKPYGVPVTADIFGLTVSAKPEDDMGIGQKIDLMVPHLDTICPMVYPSHYARGEYGIAHPNASPYAVIKRAMQDSLKRVEGTDCAVRPWLQDFSLGVRYGEKQVRDQIRAAEENGIKEYLLWNASNRYTFAATIPPKPKVKKGKATAKKAPPSPAPSPQAITRSSGTLAPAAQAKEASADEAPAEARER